MTLDSHFTTMLAKAKLRRSLLRSLSNTKWGLECGILTITSDAHIGSPLRYGLVLVGSVSPPDLMVQIDTQIINITARRNTGADRSTRIEVLHMIAGAHSFWNLYVMHCAEFFDAVLRTTDSQIRERIYCELCALRGVTTLETKALPLRLPIEATGGDVSPTEIWGKTYWFTNEYVDSNF